MKIKKIHMTKSMRKRFQTQETEPVNTLNTSKPIVLIGLMGVGKTVVGKELSQYYDLPFYDSDQVIEEQTGKKISEIFEEDGESAFRVIEYKVIKSLLQKGNAIISTGGGAFTKMFTRELIEEHAVSVWLQAPLELLVLRTSRNISKRPLLAGSDDVEATLTRLMKERNPDYSKANIAVPTFNEPVRFTNARVVKSLDQYLKRKQRKSKYGN